MTAMFFWLLPASLFYALTGTSKADILPLAIWAVAAIVIGVSHAHADRKNPPGP